jgi:hypothetical protein
MPGSKAVKERIEQLIVQARELSAGTDYGQQAAWLISVEYAVHLVCPSGVNPYNRRAHELVIVGQQQAPQMAISGMAALLARLLEEIEGGLLTTIENHAIAVTFDNFLDHGAEYLKRERKDEAAVIAGIVFEDKIRRICRVLDIGENDVPLDALITELTKRDVFTQLKAKRARAAAGLRTAAAHARWEEIELSDINPVIELTRELVAAHLE